jgi:tetratricopeptide (TPR) repeat protein
MSDSFIHTFTIPADILEEPIWFPVEVTKGNWLSRKKGLVLLSFLNQEMFSDEIRKLNLEYSKVDLPVDFDSKKMELSFSLELDEEQKRKFEECAKIISERQNVVRYTFRCNQCHKLYVFLPVEIFLGEIESVKISNSQSTIAVKGFNCRRCLLEKGQKMAWGISLFDKSNKNIEQIYSLLPNTHITPFVPNFWVASGFSFVILGKIQEGNRCFDYARILRFMAIIRQVERMGTTLSESRTREPRSEYAGIETNQRFEYLRSLSHDEVLRHIEKMEKSDPTDPYLRGIKSVKEFKLRCMALNATLEGEYEKAIKYADKGLKINPKSIYLFYLRGRSRSDIGDYENGLKDLNEAIKLCPSFAEALTERGYTKLKMGDIASAKKDLWEARKIIEPLVRVLNADECKVLKTLEEKREGKDSETEVPISKTDKTLINKIRKEHENGGDLEQIAKRHNISTSDAYFMVYNKQAEAEQNKGKKKK